MRGLSMNALADGLEVDRRTVTKVCGDHDPIGRRGSIELFNPVEIAIALIRVHGKRKREREVWRGLTSPLSNRERAGLTLDQRALLARAEAMAAEEPAD